MPNDWDIDPENNFLNDVDTDCCYYTEDEFKNRVNLKQGVSIIHFNSRSLYANFQDIKDYLGQFTTPFSVIAISETWLSQEKGMDFEIEGYEFNCLNRVNKRGGGTALFVNRRLKYKIIANMTTAIDEVCECISIEIDMEKRKNIIVSCVYRAPNSSIEHLKNAMESLFSNTEQKIAFICGDFNIDLLNPNKIEAIDDFGAAMYSMSLYPTITKPSRITADSATIIDNIYTNYLEGKVLSGILINDISDHLPVFVIYDCEFKSMKEEQETRQRRVRTEECLNKLRSALSGQEWTRVYQAADLDSAYGNCLDTFLAIYDRSCPVKQSKGKANCQDGPWIIRGLSNACKKKNTLYKKCIKNRTKENEMKYKKYKNKLTDIIRKCKKDYYNNVLEKNKNNIRGTWKILNSIIRKKNPSMSFSDYFIVDDKAIKDEAVVEGFNNFFVNVGPKLAKEIKPPQGGSTEKYLNERNPSTIFLRDTDRYEIIDIVRNFKNKTSLDWNGIDMTLVKQVIDTIVDPLTYICNLSLKSGCFPTKMKLAKVIPLYKSGEKNLFTNYRPVSLLSQF